MKHEKGCWMHRSKIAGAIFIILATVLTLLTLNGLGILGMFIVGCLLCHRGCMAHCCCDHQVCCETQTCDSHEHHHEEACCAKSHPEAHDTTKHG